jgi:hypothetical protein
MNHCDYQPTDRPGIWRCKSCGDENTRPLEKPPRRACGSVAPRQPPRKPLGYGPGTELKKLIVQLGVPACQSCKALAIQMDHWGPAGCREHRQEIVEHLRAKMKELTFRERLTAAARGAVAGMTFISLLDPAGSLLDEAIRLAEEQAGAP